MGSQELGEHGGGHLEGAVNHKVRSSSKGKEVVLGTKEEGYSEVRSVLRVPEEHLITISRLHVGGRRHQGLQGGRADRVLVGLLSREAGHLHQGILMTSKEGFASK